MVDKAMRQAMLVGALLKFSGGLTWTDIMRMDGYNDEQTDERSRRRRLDRDLKDCEGMGLIIKRVDEGESRVRYMLDRAACLMPSLKIEPEDRLLLYRVGAMYAGNVGPLQSAVQSALLKVRSADSGFEGGPVAAVRADVRRSSADAKRLDTIHTALLERRRITFSYRAPGREPESRTVAPYTLVTRRGGWYLVAYDGSRKGVRTFRVNRMKGAVKITAPKARAPEFDVPEGFDPETAFSSAVFGQGHGAFKDVRIEFKPEVAFIIENEFESIYRTKRLKDGSLELIIEQAYPDSLLRYLGEFPGYWRVTNPPELRELVLKRLEGASRKVRDWGQA